MDWNWKCQQLLLDECLENVDALTVVGGPPYVVWQVPAALGPGGNQPGDPVALGHGSAQLMDLETVIDLVLHVLDVLDVRVLTVLLVTDLWPFPSLV